MAGSDASKANVLPLAIFFATLVAIDVSYLAVFFVTLAAMRNFSQGATCSAVNSSPTSTSPATSSSTTPAPQSAQSQVAPQLQLFLTPRRLSQPPLQPQLLNLRSLSR